ncbi:AfsR/SARP family transcriptional regulator, partial [Streptomyces sp. SP18CS02]|uniref:AfsR/SARP family transcriptional regulator n=1 Tax=Streptomyces sp. SP18CS02 TaxID=3002531 RepID=UPI002E769F44
MNPVREADRLVSRGSGDNGPVTHLYRVLGTTQALGPDGAEIPLAGARLRASLTALAAAAGRVVTAPELAAQVWTGEAVPADETAAVQALVGRLRRALGRGAVASAPGGYRLDVRPEDIDLFRFERLAGDGTAALDAGRPADAARLLDEALGLWRGPALADLPARDTDALAVRAERRRTEARRARLAAEVALGRAEGTLIPLAELTAGHPLDEPLAALRIKALRAAGRPAEALQVYEEMRAGLARRLGTDPGPELRALHAELLAPAGGAPRVTSGAPTESPRRRTVPGNLPAVLTSFVGRERELEDLAGELRQWRLLTLLGPGGVGKTRLALEAASTPAPDTESGADVEGRWPDGVWLVELAPVRDEGVVPETVLTALGAREPLGWAVEGHGGDALARLVEHCARRRMLVVLDNCEHVVGAAAVVAERLVGV